MLKASFSRVSQMVLAATLMGFVFIGCQNSPFQNNYVAKVNDTIITQEKFQQKYEQLLKTMNMSAKSMESPETKPVAEMFQKVTIQNLIIAKLIAQEAEKRNINVTNAELEEMFDSHVTRMGGKTTLNDQLKQMGLSMDEFKAELKHELLKQKLVTSLTENKVKVTEKEAQRYFETNKSLFEEPEKVRARHILVAANPQDIRQELLKANTNLSEAELNKQVATVLAERKQKAESLFNQIKTNPKQFEALAQKESDDEGSAKMGGDLGYFSQDVVVPAFGQAAFSTKPGQLHDKVVQSPFGFHIIQVVDRKPAKSHSFAEVREQIIAFLENQQKSRILETWLDQKKKESKIVIAPAYDFDKKQQAEAAGGEAPAQSASAQ